MTGVRSHPNPQLRSWALGEGVERPTLWYRSLRLALRVGMSLLWKVRVFNRHYEPPSGSAVYVCNHQSFLDPILMSFALRRPMHYMARETLFNAPGFGRLIRSVNAFPVRRGTADTGALKEAMRRLKAGGQVVLFAEGTRTLDGTIGPLLPGVAMLSRRAAEWTVPVVLDGAFEAWPRWQTLPSPGNVIVQYGPPIHRDDIAGLTNEELMARIRRAMIDMQAQMRERVGRPPLTYTDGEERH